MTETNIVDVYKKASLKEILNILKHKPAHMK